ncbi:N-acetylmuramic acid 6-phosphate etherase [Aquabacterium sp.]|uniref:N-acetylmuramic acid 6-phosphate etherase n=1 Tax=Aquabacterium sp. TaxID=1872578 RepID=UPI002CC78B5C|nr:N-acetylmuramic acid 6-phosphate etherase [Aquabacterium sp.]HSW07868.1 N-acetylmuramic acid 6-phosphate etherase [Aquabacterium sp.]
MTTLRTESVHPQHAGLDGYGSLDLVRALVDDQQQALVAVQAAAGALARAVDDALPRLREGGRLVYVGAGSSGRLGMLDGVELPPTFSWPAYRAIGLLAGGPRAMFVSVEGAEDSAEQGASDVQVAEVNGRDVVVLIAASGSTPYVLGAAQAARAAGALTLGLCNNPGAPLLAAVQHPVLLDTGPEVISGSTRLKAGTAQKMALNALSSALMVRLHKVYRNLMVDLKASNSKLRQRALMLTMRASGAGEAASLQALAACADQVKPAIVMLRARCDAERALLLLQAHEGSVRAALAAAGVRDA